jgi:NADH:ubiquinone oxidoreductase subunit K
MLPEPTFNSFLMLACALLVVGAGGLAIRRGATMRLLALSVLGSAAVLLLAATDRYFGTRSGQLIAALVVGGVFVQTAAAVAIVLSRGARGTSDQ